MQIHYRASLIFQQISFGLLPTSLEAILLSYAASGMNYAARKTSLEAILLSHAARGMSFEARMNKAKRE